MTTAPSLADSIAAAAAVMPDSHLTILADRIAACTDPGAAWRITREPPVTEYTHQATAIITAWSSEPDATGPAIALALRAAKSTRKRVRDAERMDLVWTGPDTRHVRAQPTSDVVVEVIESSRRELLLVSYASSPERRIRQALTEAIARGVNVTALVENPEAAEGQYDYQGRDPFEGLNLVRYEWANEARPRTHNRPAVLHAKVILADATTAFISSANLTGRALDHNMEAGVLITGGPIPKTLRDHFRELALAGILRPID